MAKVVKISSEDSNEDIEKVEVSSENLRLKFKFSKKHAIIIICLCLLALIPSFYFYNQYQAAKNLLQNPKAQSSAETKNLVDQVGKIIDLPINEQPKVATVTDVTQLAGQSFFAKAKNGDKVLIYVQAGKAILYRESVKKIIEVSPVNTSAGTQTPLNTSPTQPTQAQPQQASAVVLNGTINTGLAKAAGSIIQTNLTNITIASTGDASKGNYTSTVVVDVSGTKADATAQVAKLLGGKVEASIPSGEAKPNADILVIIGSDYVK